MPAPTWTKVSSCTLTVPVTPLVRTRLMTATLPFSGTLKLGELNVSVP